MLRDEGVVRLGGALSEATAAALRVHVLTQLTAALVEEEGIGEDDKDEDEDEDDEADWVDCEDADDDGDAGGDSAVQAMLDAFLADGGSFEEMGGAGGSVGGGVGGGAARGGRGARTDRFSSVLAPRGEAEEARWDLRLELTPPVRSTRARPTQHPLPRSSPVLHHTTSPPHHHHTTPPHHHHTCAPPPPRPSAPPSHPRPNPSFSPGARGPARAHAGCHGRRSRSERGQRRSSLRAGRARLGAWRAGAANARGHALVRGRLPLLRFRRAAARKARDGPGSLTNVLSLTDFPAHSYSLMHLL